MTDSLISNITKRVAILGSTGSIGTQALDVIRLHPNRFSVEVLMAYSNAELLISQAREFQPRAVVIGNKLAYTVVEKELGHLGIQVYAGEEATYQILDSGTIDILLLAVVGAAGLMPALTALEAGIDIALANKESLVAGGELLFAAAQKKNALILPVDSEHSAIFQCMAGETTSSVRKIILTASGGPFLGKDLDFLQHVTPEQAIKHPNWSMGCKISVDSATMMNKGLEVIEARWLFNISPDQIEVLIHPQSVVHSLVEFIDGSMKAQLGPADMRMPIMYALSWPERIAYMANSLELNMVPSLTFQKPDMEIFRNLALAYEAIRLGGTMPCVLNAANEVAVKAFLRREIGFLQIPIVVEQTMEKMGCQGITTMDHLLTLDKEARRLSGEIIKQKLV